MYMYICVHYNHTKHVRVNGEPIELINQLASLRNSDLMPSTASVQLPCYGAFIHYIQHLLTHFVDMPYTNNNWCVK